MTADRDPSAQVVEILLVEDNPADVRLTRETLRESKIHNHLEVATDGEEALARLHRTGDHSDAARPDLILLDLNLPGMSGHELLEDVKSDPELRRIPVVVLTSSEAEVDVVKSYDLHANAYVTKPVGLDGFSRIVHAIDDFWFSVVRRPEE